MEKLESQIGIVVNNEDPTGMGKVQVYIPTLAGALPSSSKKNSYSYVFPGDDTKGDFSLQDLKTLQKYSIWAQVFQPIFGGSNMGRIDLTTGKATTSMSANETDAFTLPGTTYGAKARGSKYSSYGAVGDAFACPTQKLVQFGNYTGLDYFPENYINAPNGMFNLPNIGARVLVTFINGSRGHPIIMGKIPFSRETQSFNQ